MKAIPCPFCKSSATPTEASGCEQWAVVCDNGQCAAIGPWEDSEEAAIEKWNRRALGWISVDERLPENDNTLYFHEDSRMKFTSVLACGYSEHDSEKPFVSQVNRLIIYPCGIKQLDANHEPLNEWRWSSCFERVTHWMALPSPSTERAQS